MIVLFNNNYTFAKLCQVIKKGNIYMTDFSTVTAMFNYFDVKIGYGEDLFEKIQDLKSMWEQSKYIRGRNPKVSVDKKLLYLLTTAKIQAKHKKYYFLREIFLECDRIQFKWVMKLICSPENVEVLLT